jgi:hypothetical protein
VTVREVAKKIQEPVEQLLELLPLWGIEVSAPEDLLSQQDLTVFETWWMRVEQLAGRDDLGRSKAIRLVQAGLLGPHQVLQADLEEIAAALGEVDLREAWKVKKAIADLQHVEFKVNNQRLKF